MLYAYLARDRVASYRRGNLQAFTTNFHFRTWYLGLAYDAVRIRYDGVFFTDVIPTAAANHFCQFLVANFFVRVERLIDARRSFAALDRHFVTHFIAFICDHLGDANFRDDVRTTFFFGNGRSFPYLLDSECHGIFGVMEANYQIGRFVRI